MLHGIDIEMRVIEIRWCRTDELRARQTEELLEYWQRFWPTPLHASQLLAVLLPQRSVNRIVQTCRVESHADGNERVHLVDALGNGVILRILLEIFRAADVDEDVVEGAQSVGVAMHHHVAEANVIVCREIRRHDTREHGFLVQLDIIERLEREAEISEQAVHPKQSDNGEIAQHLVQASTPILARIWGGIFATFAGSELFADLAALDEGVEDVEDGVAAPGVWVLAQDGDFVFVYLAAGAVVGEALAVAAEGVELVDEFVDDFPSPEVLSNHVSFVICRIS
jgi:hypothetical protein